MSSDFSTTLLDWQRRHGRKDLPWQRDRDPYKIWVAEIMLQQTQVATVIPYFQRFIARFPTILALAVADVDEVLHLWTGLGYYARGRNLHRAARILRAAHDGVFPRTVDQATALPGIGRSTAHAILAFAFGQRLPILDGNVKRVLTRYHGIHGWPGKRDIEQRLWQLADANTPGREAGRYTQAIMDLGATVCKRARPVCAHCPVAMGCYARVAGVQDRLPTRAAKKTRPIRAVFMIMIRSRRKVLLERRPPTGIWGGLWGFPETQTDQDPVEQISARYGLCIRIEPPWDTLRHTFTHFHLHIQPIPALVEDQASRIMENPGLVWYNPRTPDARGLAAPVKKLLEKLR